MPRRKLMVVDSGFGRLRGHHFATALMLDAGARKNKVHLSILTDRQLASHLRPGLFRCVVRPCLTDGLYHPAAFTPGQGGVEAFFLYGEELADSLCDNATAYVDASTVVFSHTTNAVILYALAKWLHTIPQRSRPALAINVQNFIFDHETDAHVYRAAFSMLRGLDRVRLFGSNISICRLMGRYSGKTVRMMPLPFDKKLERPHGVPHETPVFGFAGEARPDKNMGILLGAIRKYLKCGGIGTFRIQAHFFLEEYPEMSDTKNELLALGREYPEMVILRLGPLYGEEYYRHIGECDAIMMSYTASLYQEGRISQVLLDTLAMGVSCLVCKESTLAEDTVYYDNGGVLLEDDSANSLTKGLFEFEDNWHGRKAAAERAREKVLAYNNVDNYFVIALDEDNRFTYPEWAVMKGDADR